MSEGGGGGADVSSMTTPSTIVIEETDGRLRAGGDDIANLAVLALWRALATSPHALSTYYCSLRNRQESLYGTAKQNADALSVRVCSQNIAGDCQQRRPLVGMGDARMVSAHQRESEQGVREVSSALFNRVTNYHAQIGANVNKETLQSLEWQVLCHRAL